jgi:hypothetical protein
VRVVVAAMVLTTTSCPRWSATGWPGVVKAAARRPPAADGRHREHAGVVSWSTPTLTQPRLRVRSSIPYGIACSTSGPVKQQVVVFHLDRLTLGCHPRPAMGSRPSCSRFLVPTLTTGSPSA